MKASWKQLPQPVLREEVEQPQHRVSSEGGSTLVTILAGERPTAGFVVKVDGVDRTGTSCVVRYHVEGPPAGAMVAQVISYPAATVRIEPACDSVTVQGPQAPGQSPQGSK